MNYLAPSKPFGEPKGSSRAAVAGGVSVCGSGSAMRGIEPIKAKSIGVLHRALRAETRSDHLMIDRKMLRFDLAQREDYGIFLNIHFSALQDLKVDWRGEDREDFQVMTRNLQNDLHVLGVATMALQPVQRSSLTVSNRLGAAYVIRGSRLGSSFLRQRVPTRFATSYLDFVPGMSWPQFLHQLEDSSQESGSEATQEVIRGARIVFNLFAHLLTQTLA